MNYICIGLFNNLMILVMKRLLMHHRISTIALLFMLCSAMVSHAQERKTDEALSATEKRTETPFSNFKNVSNPEAEKGVLQYLCEKIKHSKITIENYPKGCVTLSLMINDTEIYVTLKHE